MSLAISQNKRRVLRPEKRTQRVEMDSSQIYSFGFDQEHFVALFEEKNDLHNSQLASSQDGSISTISVEGKDASLRDEILHAKVDEIADEIKTTNENLDQSQVIVPQKQSVDGVKRVAPRTQEIVEENSTKNIHRPLHTQELQQKTKKNFLDRMTAFIDKDLEK